MMIWRNASKDGRRVKIESIEFHHRLIGTADDDEDEIPPPTAKVAIEAASVAVVTKLTELEKTYKNSSTAIVTVIIIACLFLYFARH